MADSQLEDIARALDLGAESTPVVKTERPSFAKKYILTPLGNTLDVLDTDLNAVTNALRPLVTSINPKLNEVYDQAPKKFGMPNVVMSDLVEKAFEGQPGNKVLSKVLGFAADVAFSPTTYVAGITTLTRYGKLMSRVKSLNDAGKKIEEGSAIAKELSRHYKAPFTPALVGKAVREAQIVSVPSLEARAKAGHYALINIGIPFTKTEQPFIKSQLLFRGMDKVKKFLDENKYTQAFHAVFSTSTGNPDFDAFRMSTLGLGRMSNEDVKIFSADIGKRMWGAAKEAGLSRDEYFRMITEVGERLNKGISSELSADDILRTFYDDIEKKVVNGDNIENIIKNLPGVDTQLLMDDRAKLHRTLLRLAKEKAAGWNVFTTNVLQIPLPLRNKLVEEFTTGIGIKYAQEIKNNKLIQYADFPLVFEAYNRGIKGRGLKFDPGIEAGMFALVGKREYLRLIKAEKQYGKFAHLLGHPGRAGYIGAVGTEAGAVRDIVSRIVAHVDQGFATSYGLYKTAPEYLRKISPKMFEIQKLIDSNENWKIQGLVDQFRFPLEIAKKYPKAFDFAQEIRMFMQKQLQKEQDAGVEVGEFIANIGYMPHIPTKETRQMLAKLYPRDFSNAPREWNQDHVSTLARMLRVPNTRKIEEFYNLGLISRTQRKAALKSGESYIENVLAKIKKGPIVGRTDELYNYLTVSEVNTLAKTPGGLKILGAGNMVERFFEENPATQILIRGMRGEKARTAADFYQGVTQFGKWHDVREALPEGFEYVKNEKANPLASVRTRKVIVGEKAGENVETVYERLIFDKRIAKSVDHIHTSLVVPPEMHPLLNIFDRMQDEWKAWTLAIFPAYHTRNLIGNLWNNYLAGIHTPDPYLKALAVQRGKKILITLGSGQKISGETVIKLARENGILNIGQYWGDIEKFFDQDMKNGIGRLYKQGPRKAVTMGLKTGNYIQNNANLALFIRRLEEGWSEVDAAFEVKKFQFDYTNLTDAEREVIKRVFPFFTWTRFNIPLQLEMAITHPQRLLAVAKGRNVLESNYDGVPDERLLPDYYVQNFPIRIRYDKKRQQYEYFFLNNWLPAADIDKIFDPATWIRNQLTPLLKEPAQQLANRDFFTGREIDKGDQYDTINIIGKGLKIDLPARQAHLLKNIRFVSELDRLSSSDLSGGGKFARLATGKLYPLDEAQERRNRLYKFRDRRQNLLSMLKKSRKEENTEEEKRILKKLDQISKEFRD